ncbi:MAG TPA: HAD-IA family hydrolase [Candidatus Binatia bacterium]
MTIRAIIFDFFGTLVDDFVAATGPMTPDLAMAVNAPHEQFIEHWRKTSNLRIDGTFQSVEAAIEHVCIAMDVRPSTEELAKAVEIRLSQIRRALKPKPDAVATLKTLRQRGYKIGLLSNCSIEIPILWPESPFAQFVDSAIFSSREHLKKPDPRIFDLACKRLGEIPRQCLYIADGENYELSVARRVGLHPVLIRNSFARRRQELFREATEWQGVAISLLSEVLSLVEP